MKYTEIMVLGLLVLAAAAYAQTAADVDKPVGQKLTTAKSASGDYISWREHIIDDPVIAGFNLSGSDGLVMGDIDGDGFEDIVSVHESDSEYDSALADPSFTPPPEGHVRIAFASANPNSWVNITLAEGADAPAPEDAAIADFNGDGHLDVIVAAELAHLIYLQNPGRAARTTPWERLILPMTKGQGSYIRVFAADFDGDGVAEATAPNKGAQRPSPDDYARSTPVSLYRVVGDPLTATGWSEHVLGRYSVPQNAEPVDLDGDGDLDILGGSRGENRIVFFENTKSPTGAVDFIEHAIGIIGTPGMRTGGFNLLYADLNHDGRTDIVGAAQDGLVWLEQPTNIDDGWVAHFIGTFAPDSMTGIELADIDGDGDQDIIGGSYSRGERMDDGDVDLTDRLGRLGWFENPGAGAPQWRRHDISRRKRGMFDKFVARDLDGDGDVDFVSTRGNSAPYDGVFWLEQVRTQDPARVFTAARERESAEVALPKGNDQ